MPKETNNHLIVMPLMRSNANESYILPLGILYISSAMKKAGLNVETLNLNHHTNPMATLQKTIIKKKIDVVLSGGMSPQYSEIKQIFNIAKKTNNKIISICGGGIIAGDPIPAMLALEVDYGVIGEGEETTVELCQYINAAKNFTEVNGIIFKNKNDFEITKSRRAIKKIDEIPWPDYDGFNFKEFLEVSNIGTNGLNCNRAGMIITSRSCPFACTFCFHTSGRTYRQRSMDEVFKEIDLLTSKYNVGFLYISDELFSQSIDRVDEFCRRIKAYNIPWNASFRVDGINDQVLQLLKNANCASIGIGVKSADPSVLKSMNKRVTIEQIENALEKIHSAQIPVVGNFIFGDIAETSQTANNTIEWWKKNQRYGLFMKMIKVYPGTGLYKYALKNNIIKNPVTFLKEGCPPINVSKMSNKEMGELVTKITLLPLQENAKIHNATLLSINNGKCDLQGNCQYCNQKNTWQSVSLFSLNYVTCHNCKEKLATTVPKSIINSIDTHLDKLIANGNKIALWGMADYSMEFLTTSNSVKNNEDIYLIDLSTDKQLMHINNKKVYAPSVINQKNIDTIIVLVPVFYSTIKSNIESSYPNIKIISIIDLFN